MLSPLFLALLVGASLHAKTHHPARKPAKAASAKAAKPPSIPLYVQRSTDPIIVVWPPEGLEIPGAEAEFIFGSVSKPQAPFKINGQAVPVYKNGAFLAWLPVSPGTFTFRCSLELGSSTPTFARSVFIPPGPAPLPESPAVDAASLWPKTDQELRTGDWLQLRMHATPHQRAQFKLPGRSWEPMREAAPSIYEGFYQVQAGDRSSSEAVEYRLEAGWSSRGAKSPGRVSLNDGTPPVAALRAAGKVIRGGPGEGYLLFPSSGTRLLVLGKTGAETKVSLTPELSGWADTKDLELLAAGTPPPRAVSGTIATRADKSTTTLSVSLSEKVPFLVEEGADLKSVTVRLFTTVNHTNWIIYDPADTFIQEARFRQEPGGVLAVTARLSEPLWGYQAFFEGTSFKLELRRAPALPRAGSVLAGRTIFLDPGHMPSASGATGPMGTKEMDANYAIARAVEARLAKEGAFPILSRDTTWQEVSLVERPRLAVAKKADIFVSLHNNALPDGENPFSRPRGYSVFYYHPHSLALAREEHASYQKRVPLPDEELRYGDLLVARLSAMPAILIESAYMILPEEEEKLNDPEFRDVLAQAVVEGLRAFLEKERARQYAEAPALPAPKRKGKRS